MAALAADVNFTEVGECKKSKRSSNAASTTYYAGAIVYTDTGGGVQVTRATGDRFAGISTKRQVVAAGDEVEIFTVGEFGVPLGNGPIAAADEGELLVCDASGTMTDNWADMDAVAIAADDAIIGRITRVTSTQMFISINPAGLSGSLGADIGGA